MAYSSTWIQISPGLQPSSVGRAGDEDGADTAELLVKYLKIINTLVV